MRKSKEDIQNFIRLYSSGHNLRETAILAGSNAQTVGKYIAQAGIMRKNGFRPTNSIAFEEINGESAYWLGFIAADGHIRDSEIIDKRNGKKRRDALFSLELNEKDLNHLYLIKDFIGEGNIYKRGRNDGCYIYACRRHFIVDNLKQWLPTNNKTEVVKIPENISKQNKMHFIRGYIDGDGSIFGSSISITSCPVIIESITMELGLPFRIYQKKNNKASTISYNKKESLLIYNMVDGSNSLRLNRKWERLDKK